MAQWQGISKVVFVGNLPYDATEQEVQKVFEVAGPVVSFRHVFDRDSNKAKGFGFCEYYDTETAASAVRNLNGVAEVRGRALRVDFAQPDIKDLPKDQRGATDKFGLPPLPPGVILPPGENPAERIHRVMQNIAPAQLLDTMHQLKGLVANNPEQARALLGQNPQLAYAIFQAMLMMNIVDPSVLQRMIVPGSANAANAMNIQNSAFNSAGGYGAQPGPPQNFAQSAPYGGQPPFSQGGYPQAPPGPAPYQQPGFQGGPPQGYPAQGAPPGGFRPQGNFPQAGPGPQQPAYGMPPPQQPQNGFGGPGQAPPGGQPVANPQQQALLQQVLSMTQQQVDALPPDQRATVLAIRQSAGRM